MASELRVDGVSEGTVGAGGSGGREREEVCWWRDEVDVGSKEGAEGLDVEEE